MIKAIISKILNLFFTKKETKKVTSISGKEVSLSFAKCSSNIVADIIISSGKQAVYVATISNINQFLCKNRFPEGNLCQMSLSGDGLEVMSVGTLPDSDDLNMFIEISVNNVCLYLISFKHIRNFKQDNKSISANCVVDYIKVVNIIGQTYH